MIRVNSQSFSLSSTLKKVTKVDSIENLTRVDSKSSTDNTIITQS